MNARRNNVFKGRLNFLKNSEKRNGLAKLEIVFYELQSVVADL